MFAREVVKPIVGMYAIFSLSSPVPIDQLRDTGVVLQVASTMDQQSAILLFGIHSDSDMWHEHGPSGERPVPVGAVRCKVWACPKISTGGTMGTVIDDLLVFGFSSVVLDRLEAGALMNNSHSPRSESWITLSSG